MKTRQPPFRHPLRLWRENHQPFLRLEDAAPILKTSTVSVSRIECGKQRPGPDLEDVIVRKTGITRDELARAYRILKQKQQQLQESAA